MAELLGSGESSDSDVELVRPRHVKRRRMLPGTLPAPVSVYSNKVNSCLKLPPNDSSTLAQMAKELQRVHGPEDLESESATEPPLTKNNKPQVYDLSDSEGEGRLDSQQARLRDASPSPPPTPENRKQRRGRAYRKIREVEAQLKDLGTFLSPSHKSITENDVIIVGSSPAPELTVKVRRRGELFRINLHTLDPLQKLAESVASQLHVKTSQVLLLLRDEELKHTQTPHSLNLTVADIIDCVVISPSEAPEAENQSEEKICLQVQGKEKPSHLTVTLGKTEPLQSLMDQYKAAKGLTQKDTISFIFEGKKLKGKSTAEDLGLESDDIIEVWV